jgi:hypothetical protein
MDSNQRSRIEFDPATHTYRVDGKVYPSVTQLLPKQEYYVSDERLAECADEGTAIHKEISDFMKTGESTSPYTDAMQSFLDEHKEIEGFVCSEEPMFSVKGFCGTPDLVFENAIVDVKRTFGNKKIHALQTAGYQQLVFENGISKKTKLHYILVLHDDGTYDVTNVYNDQAATVFESLVQRYKIDRVIEYYMNKI